MSMSDTGGVEGEAESEATVRAGLDAGVIRFSTADFSGTGHHELILRSALRNHDRTKVQISVSFGILCDPSGGFQGVDTRPVAVKSALAYTLRRLGTNYVDIYRPARLSTDVPVEDTVGAIAELVQAGYVRAIGLSDVDGDTLRRAARVHPISDLLTGYSVFARGIEREVLPVARELGTRISVYGGLPPGRHATRLAGVMRDVAGQARASVTQVAIAWALSRGPDIVPLVAVTCRERLADALGAARLRLGPEEFARMEAALPAGGNSSPDAAWPAGGGSTPGAAPQVPLNVAPPRRRTGAAALTGREEQVLGLLTGGITNRAIANRLGISERTAREHVARILLKLRVESRVEAAVLATEWRLARSPERPRSFS